MRRRDGDDDRQHDADYQAAFERVERARQLIREMLQAGRPFPRSPWVPVRLAVYRSFFDVNAWHDAEEQDRGHVVPFRVRPS